VPTLDESGLRSFAYATWYGMLVPAGTQRTIVEYLRASTVHVLRAPHVAERFTGQGLETHATTSAEFDRYLRTEIDKWAGVVKAAGIRVE